MDPCAGGVRPQPNSLPRKDMSLEKDLTEILNRHSRENQSDTPNGVLARYLIRCLNAYEDAVRQRDVYLGLADETGLEVVGKPLSLDEKKTI